MWYVQQNIEGHNTNPSGYAGMYRDPYGYKTIAQIMRESDYDRCIEKKFLKLVEEAQKNKLLKQSRKDVE